VKRETDVRCWRVVRARAVPGARGVLGPSVLAQMGWEGCLDWRAMGWEGCGVYDVDTEGRGLCAVIAIGIWL